MNLTLKILGIAVFALMLVPASANAQSYYTNSSGSVVSQQELIAQLLQLIAQLQAQLDARDGHTGGVSNYGIDIETVGADDITDESASLFGNIDLGRASSARVWFEYGESRNFGEKTLTGVAENGSHYTTFRADVEGLDEDQRYFFRAVAEDPAGRFVFGSTEDFETDGDDRDDDDNDDEDQPEVTTEEADDVDEDRAELSGEVDMNDFEDGLVFFVYGQDEDLVEEIEDEYNEYDDIDEEDEDLRKFSVDSSLDGSDSYTNDVSGLEEDAEYFFQICVQYEDEDDDETIACGGVEEFDTDGNGDEDENDEDHPEVTTEEAMNVEDDEAELHGEVDMNDFEDGLVFFVYGEDDGQIEDIENDYDTYEDIDEDDDDLQKVQMDSSLDDSASYELELDGLNDDTEYFFQICVEYDDEDGDEMLRCGGVEDFVTED